LVLDLAVFAPQRQLSSAEQDSLLVARSQALGSLGVDLDPSVPEDGWGLAAQQSVEKLSRAWIVLADRQSPQLQELADLAGQTLDPFPRELQVFAVEARGHAAVDGAA
jgi:hypothetical protein